MMTVCDESYNAIQEMIANERHAEATAALEKLVGQCNDYAPAHFDLGNLHYAAGNKDQALNHFEKAVALAPENPAYLKSLADLSHIEGQDVRRALTLYEKLLSIHPEDTQTLMIAGHLCVSLERLDEALSHYNRILDIEPWNLEAQQFSDRIAQQPDGYVADTEPEILYQRCQNLVNQGRIDQALAGLESLVTDHPDFALAHNDLGVLYYQRGNKERCVESYEKAVAIDPENDNFKKNLADFYLVEQGRVKEALEIYLSVLKDNEEDIDALLVAGHICLSLGKSDSARVFYDRVLDIEPWNIEAGERLEQLPGELS